MAWVRIDADAPLHPKIVRVGPGGFGFFTASLAYANHFLTDGFIPAHALVAVFPGVTERQALAFAVKLVEANLWEKREDPPGWMIHDFHDYQPTRKEVLESRDEAHRVKVMGGKARANNAARLRGRFTSRPPAAHQHVTSPVPVPVPDTEKQRRRATTTTVVLADDRFIESLKTNPAYQGIDVDREIGKLDAWLLTPRGKGKQKTRGRIVNWLNRVDRPMVLASSAAPRGRNPNHSISCECERCAHA